MCRSFAFLTMFLIAVLLTACGSDSEKPNLTTAAADPAQVSTNSGPDVDPDSCDAKGINSTEGKTGTCVEDGLTRVVVNRRGALELDGYRVRLRKLFTFK